MKHRSIRSRADARLVAGHAVGDANTLWRAVRHGEQRSVIREDEILPIHALRESARHVARLLGRRGNHRKHSS